MSNLLVPLLRLSYTKTTGNSKFSEFFLHLIETLVVTFNETRAPTSIKYVAEKAIEMPDWSKTFQTFWSHHSVFAIEKLPKNLNFQSFFTSNKPSGGYFHWNACTDFQKRSSWTRYSDAKSIKNISNFLVALLHFCYRKTTESSKFLEFFTFNRPFGGYFQRNACTDFQKICCWTSYSDAESMKNISDILVALLRFCLRKRT